MRIDQLTLKNFRCFEERTFAFHPQFTLVVGVNGTGKTALLDALATALSTWFIGLSTAPRPRSVDNADVRMHCEQTESGYRYPEHWPVRVDAIGRVPGCPEPLAWAREKVKAGGNTRYGEAGELLAVARAADTALKESEQPILPLLGYYGAGRLWMHRPQDLRRESRVNNPEKLVGKRDLKTDWGYRGALEPGIPINQIMRWFAREAWATFQNGQETTGLKVVREAILLCVEGADWLFFEPQRGELVIQFENGETQPFSNLSDGQRVMLALVADIAQRACGLNPHLGVKALKQTPGVVLVDELDLHLHPRWQRRVIEDLRRTFPMLQFICTTHSPFLIQSLRSGEELQMLEGQPLAQLGNKPLDEIAAGIMGVVQPQISNRYAEMKGVAEDYLQTLDQAASSPQETLDQYMQQLADKVAPYADNPAFQAVLEMERVLKLGE